MNAKVELSDVQKMLALAECWTTPPRCIVVYEYNGHGDPSLGGNAEDRVLAKSGRLVPDDEANVKREGGVAYFRTIEDAAVAVEKITNRRKGAALSVIPQWPAPTERRFPRLLSLLVRNCLLTKHEALAALERREAEAVRHLGGWKKAIQYALECRHLPF
jgi:hypothetical protein